MPGDYSRTTFDRSKHYSGVLKQQGRVALDADDNEQLAIQNYRTEVEATDVIGLSGVPKKSRAFEISLAPVGNDLNIHSGFCYIEGMLCELDQRTNYSTQPYLPNPEFTVPSGTDPQSRQLDLPHGSYLVFLDAWKREITALDDEHIREVALGGPDTAARLQNVWQVRLLKVNPQPNSPLPLSCETEFPEFDQYRTPSSGSLKARTQPPQSEESACLLPPGTGYTRLENQLYRVEIQTGGAVDQATFKWSRDNASVETTITNIAGNVLTVAEWGKDTNLNFAPGQWVEIVTEESTLKSRPNALAQIDLLGPGANEITLKTSADAFANSPGLKLRRWDQNGTTAQADGLRANLATWIDLEAGVQVGFEAGEYRAGDFWLIPARAATGQIEWPVDPVQGPTALSPNGIKHRFCRLALIESHDAGIDIKDCRKLFPSLTEICAEDVCFDNRNCQFDGAKNVQQALDILCSRHEAGQCTFVVAPGENIQAVFDAIPPKGDAEICFQAGHYELPEGVRVVGKGNLKISGVGFGTSIKAAKTPAALKFLDCTSVLVRDIFAEAGTAGVPIEDPDHSPGALAFQNCESVNLESVRVRCAPQSSPISVCIAVVNKANMGSVRVQHCVLEPGDQQVGLYLINLRRTQVEDNWIRVGESAKIPPARKLKDRRYRASLRKLLISEARLGAVRGRRDQSNVIVSSANNQTIHFRTEKPLKNAWAALLQKHPATNAGSPRALLAHVVKLANRLVLDSEFRKRFKPFSNYLDLILEQTTPVARRGIVVAGDKAEEVRIINNTIEGVWQGIHLGVSNPDEPTPRFLETVTIAGNTILITLIPQAGSSDRHAIFVGNCGSLLIQNNNARVSRLDEGQIVEINGIVVWGVLGDRALVTQNHLDSADGDKQKSFHTGITMNPFNHPDHEKKLWLVDFNVAPSRVQTVSVSNGAVENNNIP